MAKQHNLCWFMVKRQHISEMFYLCYADGLGEALQSFAFLAEGEKVVQLNWGQLSELTGCIIPCQCRRGDYAKGNMVFEHNDKRIVLWHNVIWRG